MQHYQIYPNLMELLNYQHLESVRESERACEMLQLSLKVVAMHFILNS